MLDNKKNSGSTKILTHSYLNINEMFRYSFDIIKLVFMIILFGLFLMFQYYEGQFGRGIILGIPITLKYSIISVVFGCLIGGFLGACKTSKYVYLKLFANIYTSIFRGTPLLIQVSIIYFTNIKLEVFTAGIIAFSLNSGAYISEIIRAGITSVDRGQIEAARALSIPSFFITKDIIIPQAVRRVLPALVNEVINMVKESAIISILGEMDIMRRAQVAALNSYNYFTPMITAAICYYFIVLILDIVAKILEKRLEL